MPAHPSLLNAELITLVQDVRRIASNIQETNIRQRLIEIANELLGLVEKDEVLH